MDRDGSIAAQRAHSVALIHNDHSPDWQQANSCTSSQSDSRGIAIVETQSDPQVLVTRSGRRSGSINDDNDDGTGAEHHDPSEVAPLSPKKRGAPTQTPISPPLSKQHRPRSPRGNILLPDLTSTRLRIEMSCLMLGLYGVMTFLFSVPLLAIWNAAKIEEFKTPASHKLTLLLINTALDSVYNALLLFGILTTSPLFMSVGTMLVMPCSMVTDRLLHGVVMGPVGITGAVVIVCGFAMLNLPDSVNDKCVAAVLRCIGKHPRSRVHS